MEKTFLVELSEKNISDIVGYIEAYLDEYPTNSENADNLIKMLSVYLPQKIRGTEAYRLKR